MNWPVLGFVVGFDSLLNPKIPEVFLYLSCFECP